MRRTTVLFVTRRFYTVIIFICRLEPRFIEAAPRLFLECLKTEFERMFAMQADTC